MIPSVPFARLHDNLVDHIVNDIARLGPTRRAIRARMTAFGVDEATAIDALVREAQEARNSRVASRGTP